MSDAVLILGDQLSLSLSSLQAAAPDAEIFMAEVADEAVRVNHNEGDGARSACKLELERAMGDQGSPKSSQSGPSS